MENLEKVVCEFLKINNSVIGSPEHGIVTSDDNGAYSLSLEKAEVAIEKGEVAMVEALENETIYLGTDFEL